MFPSTRRAIVTLFRTPLVPPPPGPPILEMTTIAGPSRPRAASRAYSNMSIKSVKSNYLYSSEASAGTTGNYTMGRRYASDKGQKELYSDEAGSTGAGTDDVAHTDAAFDKNANPETSAKNVEKETGKDFTQRSPANADESHPPGKQGKPQENDAPLNTSKREAEGKK